MGTTLSYPTSARDTEFLPDHVCQRHARLECDVVVVVVVATDSYNSEETPKTEAIIPPNEDIENPKARNEVIIGVTY